MRHIRGLISTALFLFCPQVLAGSGPAGSSPSFSFPGAQSGPPLPDAPYPLFREDAVMPLKPSTVLSDFSADSWDSPPPVSSHR